MLGPTRMVLAALDARLPGGPVGAVFALPVSPALDWPFGFTAAAVDLALGALESVVLAIEFPNLLQQMGTTKIRRCPSPGLGQAQPPPHQTNFRFFLLTFPTVLIWRLTFTKRFICAPMPSSSLVRGEFHHCDRRTNSLCAEHAKNPNIRSQFRRDIVF